jgi:hypothetical protein
MILLELLNIPRVAFMVPITQRKLKALSNIKCHADFQSVTLFIVSKKTAYFFYLFFFIRSLAINLSVVLLVPLDGFLREGLLN